jgi:hypothetical protein
MDVVLWVIVGLTLVLGIGMFLLIPGERLLADRAEELGMWPDHEDVPRRPWRIWPGWTLAVWLDLFRRSEQRDPKYLRYQMRVRLGALLVFVGFAGIAIVAGLSES